MRLTPLLLASSADDGQPAGSEDLPQLRLGEQAHVRRIARRLEPVERRSVPGVIGCELVDNQDTASGPSHARELGDDAIRPRDVMERPVRAREVERGVGKRERGPVPLHEVGVRRRTLARECDQLGHGIKTDDLPHKGREGERQRTGTRPDVENTLVAARLDELPHLFGEPR